MQKGESRGTLETLYKGENPSVKQGKYLTGYTISYHVAFPIIVIVFLGWLFHHSIENNKKNFFSNFRTNDEHHTLIQTAENTPSQTSDTESTGSLQSEQAKHWKFEISSRNMYIMIFVFGSLTFIVYMLVLDCLAMGYRNEKVMADIFFVQRLSKNFTLPFEAEYSIPHNMFAYDLTILVVVLILLSSACCGVKRWYYVFLGPCSCIVVHSYHILIGFIHTPYHALGILVFYAIVLLVFVLTYKAAYYNLVHCVLRCINWKKKLQTPATRETQTPEIQTSTTRETKTLELQTLATRETQKSATDQKKCLFTFKNCILIICDILFCTDFTKCCKVSRNCCMQGGCKSILYWLITSCLILLSFFISVVLVYVVILFLIVPINLAIDDAPNLLLSIHQTILIFITAAITYKLYKDRKESTVLDQLVKANTERLKNQRGNQQSDENNQHLNQGDGGNRGIEQRNIGNHGVDRSDQDPNLRGSNQPQNLIVSHQSNTNNLKTWKNKHKEDQQIEMAGLLLDALLTLKQQGQPNNMNV